MRVSGGLMVDTARHFVPVAELEAALDGMAASGLNVFHWHLTDAQAFPWNASAEPALVAGAYRADLTYSRADLVGLVRAGFGVVGLVGEKFVIQFSNI